MKKLLSIILSVVMLLSVSVATVNAFAAGGVGSIESTTKQNKVVLEVNGKTSTDVTYERDPDDPRQITFTYTGDGELIGWEFPGMEEGVDYEIISEDGNSITILVSADYEGDVVANAIVKEATTSKPTETTKKTDEEKSPKTGAASAAGLVAMGAGAAILTALKKKEDAE